MKGILEDRRVKTMKIHFFIIVVSYNSGDKLRTTLRSIYSQDYYDYDVIIEDSLSDDGSIEGIGEDKSEDMIRGMEHTHIYVEKDEGIYDGMNRALSRTDALRTGDRKGIGDYVLFLNCGDRLHDRQVLGAIADAASDRLSDASYDKASRPHIFYGDQYNLMMKSHVSSCPRLSDFALFRNVPCHQVCFYDISLFDDRGYDTGYRVRADYEHFLHCVYKKDAVTEYVDVTVSDYEGGGFSETADNLRISSMEHKKITAMYMGRKAEAYSLLLKLSLSGLRTYLANDPRFSSGYNRIKSLIYKKGDRA